MPRPSPLVPIDPARAARWTRGSSRPPRRLARVTAIRRETADAVSLVLEPLDGRPTPYRAGQYLTLQLELDSQRPRRAYSLSRPPGGPLEVTVKANRGGLVSRYICERLQTGEVLQIMGPSGSFGAPEGFSGTLVCAAAGAGITPVIAIIEELLQTHPGVRIQLLYGNRREQDILFRERLDALAGRFPQLVVRHLLTRPEPGWPGLTGRLRPDTVLQAGGQDLAKACFLLCGPGDFLTQIGDGLRAAGIPPARIGTEQFRSAAAPTAPRPTEPHPVHFRGHDRTILVRPGESILEAGLRSGLDLPYSCTVGGCGNCRMRKLAGPVSMDEPNCLADAERAGGEILACSSYPLGRVEVMA